MKYIALIGTAAQQSYNRELLQFMKHHFSQRATIDVNEITGIPLLMNQLKIISRRPFKP
ncbi:hypothetical protein MAA39_12135 [Lactiplantibacillus plantarum]|nr:hypothetical protein [Lactiplantibacillus plantarum]